MNLLVDLVSVIFSVVMLLPFRTGKGYRFNGGSEEMLEAEYRLDIEVAKEQGTGKVGWW